MKVEQRRWTMDEGWETISNNNLGETASLVFIFGGRDCLGNAERVNEINAAYPNSQKVFASTSGEFLDTEVTDDSLAVTAILFEKTKLEFAQTNVTSSNESFSAGEKLASELSAKGVIKHVIVISEGLKVNGTDLVRGMSSKLPNGVAVTGGLAGDAARFEKTLVSLNSAPSSGTIVAIGFYGDSLKIGFGSQGGWSTFGEPMQITKSTANVLYELNGKTALSIYKNYLGENAKDLPGAALSFPLQVSQTGIDPLVRTILTYNDQDGSMVFAGDMPMGSTATMMRAKLENLIQGAEDSASVSLEPMGDVEPEFALCVSCVGRKLVLKGRTSEELEAVKEKLKDTTAITGFYSYGEIAPYNSNTKCELHNQTMTITLMAEV